MKKVLILGANSYIGNSFQKYIGENYNDQYEVHKVSLRGEAWKEDDWSGYDSILNVTGKAHADIGILTEEQKQEYAKFVVKNVPSAGSFLRNVADPEQLTLF